MVRDSNDPLEPWHLSAPEIHLGPECVCALRALNQGVSLRQHGGSGAGTIHELLYSCVLLSAKQK